MLVFLKHSFSLCGELKGKLNVSTFFANFAWRFASAVQYNHPVNYPKVKELCDIMVNSKEPLVSFNTLAKTKKIYFYGNGKEVQFLNTSYANSFERLIKRDTVKSNIEGTRKNS